MESTDEWRAALVDKLFALNDEMHKCIEKGNYVENSIMNDELNLLSESTSVTAFIDATIASAITPHAAFAHHILQTRRGGVCPIAVLEVKADN